MGTRLSSVNMGTWRFMREKGEKDCRGLRPASPVFTLLGLAIELTVCKEVVLSYLP